MKSFERLVDVLVLCLCLSQTTSCTEPDTKKQTSGLEQKIIGLQTERDQLRSRVEELEAKEKILERKNLYCEDDVQRLERDAKDYERKMNIAAKEYMEIYLEKRELNKVITGHEEDKKQIKEECDEFKRQTHKMKLGMAGDIALFKNKMKEFNNEDRDESWNNLVRLYGECWITVKNYELNGHAAPDSHQKDKTQLEVCNKHAGEMKLAFQECSTKLKDAPSQAHEKNLMNRIEQLESQLEEMKTDAIQCQDEVNTKKDKIIRTIDKFHDCKLQKQTHKVLQWFMAKELVVMPAQLENITFELNQCNIMLGDAETTINTLKSASEPKPIQHSNNSNGDGSLPDCEEKLTKKHDMLMHYQEQFAQCKLKKQTHKVLKWHMAKELVVLREDVRKLDEIIQIKELKSENDVKTLLRGKKDIDKLGKEHINLQRDHAHMKTECDQKKSELTKCMASWEHEEFVRKGTEMVMHQLEDSENKLKAEIELLEKETNDAIAGAQSYRWYFAICMITLVGILTVKLYHYIMIRYEEYLAELREEKSTLRKERREGKGKKPKTH